MMKMLLCTTGGPERTVTCNEIPLTDEKAEMRAVENQVVNLYPDFEYQTITGFGGALTEAAGYALSRVSEEKRKEMIDAYFGKDGNRYSLIRTHIDSCDFSCGMYQAVSDVNADPDLLTFSLERDHKFIIPAIKEILETSEVPIAVLLSPWSPPAEWKTSSEMIAGFKAMGNLQGLMATEQQDMDVSTEHPIVRAIMEAVKNAPEDGSGTRTCGGHLKPEYYGKWAQYITKYVQAYLKEGIPVKYLTIQNESQAATPWDSCQWTPEEQKDFLKDHLYPAFKEAGLSDKVGIYFWDHNKENLVNWTMAMVDEETKDMIEGAAFHWYSGDHFEAVQMISEHYPDLHLMFSEGCCDFVKDDPDTELLHAERYAHDIIGNLNAGMDSWYDWNLYLDEVGGPNHVGNYCSSPIMLDGEGGYEKKASYDYIGHFTRYLTPGSKRIGFSKYTKDLEVTAFKDLSGKIIVVFLNTTDQVLPVNLRLKGYVGKFSVPARSITTAVI